MCRGEGGLPRFARGCANVILGLGLGLGQRGGPASLGGFPSRARSSGSDLGLLIIIGCTIVGRLGLLVELGAGGSQSDQWTNDFRVSVGWSAFRMCSFLRPSTRGWSFCGVHVALSMSMWCRRHGLLLVGRETQPLPSRRYWRQTWRPSILKGKWSAAEGFLSASALHAAATLQPSLSQSGFGPSASAGGSVNFRRGAVAL